VVLLGLTALSFAISAGDSDKMETGMVLILSW
jgi:hypothetical protein